MATIEFRQTSVTIGNTNIVESIDAIWNESSIALIGANGSGKSTLARLINGLISPTSGNVLIDGVDVTNNATDIRRRVGFVFTNPAAQVVMPTVIEDIALSLRRNISDRKQRNERSLEILRDFGLHDLAHVSVHNLSGGQLQLLAIAGVLATEPQIVVADEPTTLLDLANSKRIGSLLLGLNQQLILATHDLDLALACERTIVMDRGHIVFDGDSLDAVKFYQKLVDA